jgi:hypothetical protein
MKTTRIISLVVGLTLAATVSHAKAPCRTVSDAVASFSQYDMERTVKFVVEDDDRGAFEHMLKSNRVFPLKTNLPVFIEEYSGLLIQIRQEGHPSTVWTAYNSVTCWWDAPKAPATPEPPAKPAKKEKKR